MDRVDVASCSCTVNDEGEWANQIGCEKHVPGLWDRFVSVSVGGLLRVIDLKLIDPYIKIITHGGKDCLPSSFDGPCLSKKQ